MAIKSPPTGRKREKKDGPCWFPETLRNPVFRQSNGLSERPILGCSCGGASWWWFLLGYSAPALRQTRVGSACPQLGQLGAKPAEDSEIKANRLKD